MTDLKELRERIDAQHKEAIQALEIVGRYLAPVNGATATMPSKPGATAAAAPTTTRRRQSLQDRVIEAIKKDWATTTQISAVTKLTAKQVRGVLHAAAVKGQIEKRLNGEEMQYRFRNAEAKD